MKRVEPSFPFTEKKTDIHRCITRPSEKQTEWTPSSEGCSLHHSDATPHKLSPTWRVTDGYREHLLYGEHTFKNRIYSDQIDLLTKEDLQQGIIN